jgi:hypothetical protein
MKHICQATAAIGARSWRFELQLDLLACVGVLVGPLRQRLGDRARRSFAAGKKRVSATMASLAAGSISASSPPAARSGMSLMATTKSDQQRMEHPRKAGEGASMRR